MRCMSTTNFFPPCVFLSLWPLVCNKRLHCPYVLFTLKMRTRLGRFQLLSSTAHVDTSSFFMRKHLYKRLISTHPTSLTKSRVLCARFISSSELIFLYSNLIIPCCQVCPSSCKRNTTRHNSRAILNQVKEDMKTRSKRNIGAANRVKSNIKYADLWKVCAGRLRPRKEGKRSVVKIVHIS